MYYNMHPNKSNYQLLFEILYAIKFCCAALQGCDRVHDQHGQLPAALLVRAHRLLDHPDHAHGPVHRDRRKPRSVHVFGRKWCVLSYYRTKLTGYDALLLYSNDAIIILLQVMATTALATTLWNGPSSRECGTSTNSCRSRPQTSYSRSFARDC